MEKILKQVNSSMVSFMQTIGRFSFCHEELEGFTLGLYREGWIHLSDIGLDIFNLHLQDMVEKAALLLEGSCRVGSS